MNWREVESKAEEEEALVGETVRECLNGLYQRGFLGGLPHLPIINI